MRKIDKTLILATKYKEWEENFEEKGLPHDKYDSSNGDYYLDIVMNLLHCQKGLCAYTEIQLCGKEYLSLEKWEEGTYKGVKANNGALEHFDESLKSKKKDIVGKKDWLWANFFVIDSDTNTRKGAKTVDYILKPDTVDYEPFVYLEYDANIHHFVPNPTLSEAEKTRVRNMIEILGLNFPNIVDKRKISVNKRLREMDLGIYEANEYEEFPTAFIFCSRIL